MRLGGSGTVQEIGEYLPANDQFPKSGGTDIIDNGDLSASAGSVFNNGFQQHNWNRLERTGNAARCRNALVLNLPGQCDGYN